MAKLEKQKKQKKGKLKWVQVLVPSDEESTDDEQSSEEEEKMLSQTKKVDRRVTSQ